MAVIYLTGNDGSFGPTGGIGCQGLISTWAATVSRTSTVLTGFADTGTRRRLGISDVTGSCGGHLQANAANSDPYDNILLPTDSGIGTYADGVTMVLSSAVSTYGGGAACTLNFSAVINSVAVSADKNGDQTVTFNFEQSNGVAATSSWDES